MIIVEPSYEILRITDNPLELIELAGRVCYKSEDRIDEESHKRFIRMIMKNHHESVIEHSLLTVRFIINRAIANELIRHRIASYSQESTRYVSYNKDKFNNQISVIKPMDFGENHVAEFAWRRSCEEAERSYLQMLENGTQPQIARDVLPLCLKTEIVMSANFREWKYVFKMRCDKSAHPQMRELMISLREECRNRIPIIFEEEE